MSAVEDLHHHGSVSWRIWLAVVALGVSSFAIVTTELAPIGLLSPLAAEFGQTEGKAGLVVTAYGWIAAFVALFSATFLGRLPRKLLLVSLMLDARMIGALAHGAF